jgi:hypothetical protein
MKQTKSKEIVEIVSSINETQIPTIFVSWQIPVSVHRALKTMAAQQGKSLVNLGVEILTKAIQP